MRVIALAGVALGVATVSLRAQSMTDGGMMPKRALALGVGYSRDSWDHYWEGTLNRTNENLGTVTTQSATVSATYGVSDRFTVVASLPYVSTHASQGPLHGMRGLQDAMLGAKYRLLTTPFTSQGIFSAMLSAAAELPASNYSPDFLPMSIGLGSKCFTSRFTMNFQSTGAWFISGSAAHSWRNKVTLDRSSYFTDGHLYLGNEVVMPRVVDGSITAGLRTGRWTIPLSLSQHRTLGGGDIRRQDMPFTSNRMNGTQVGGGVTYDPTGAGLPAMHFGVTRTLYGRNIGQSTTFVVGSSYMLNF